MRRPCQRRSADEMSEGRDHPRRRLRGDRRRSLRHHFSYVEAPFFGISLSISIVLYVLFGGTQSALRPLLGAALFTRRKERMAALFRTPVSGIGKPVPGPRVTCKPKSTLVRARQRKRPTARPDQRLHV